MEKEYPKNRTDLILMESIDTDIKTLRILKNKYRGAERKNELKGSFKVIESILMDIINDN